MHCYSAISVCHLLQQLAEQRHAGLRHRGAEVRNEVGRGRRAAPRLQEVAYPLRQILSLPHLYRHIVDLPIAAQHLVLLADGLTGPIADGPMPPCPRDWQVDRDCNLQRFITVHTCSASSASPWASDSPAAAAEALRARSCASRSADRSAVPPGGRRCEVLGFENCQWQPLKTLHSLSSVPHAVCHRCREGPGGFVEDAVVACKHVLRQQSKMFPTPGAGT